MKRYILFIVIFISISGINIHAATITSNAINGNWSNTTSWVGNILPTANDTVVIAAGSNITVDNNSCIAYKCRILNTGTLNCSSYILTLAGSSTSINVAGTDYYFIGNGSLSIYTGGTFNLQTGTLKMTGGLLTNGTFNCGTGTVIFDTKRAPISLSGANTPIFYNVINNDSVPGTWPSAGGFGVTLHSTSTTFKGDVVINGTFNRNSTVNNNATVIFDGITHLSGVYSFYLNHIIINAGATVYGGSKNIYLYGNWTSNGTFICELGTITAKYDTYSSCQPNSQTIFVANPDLNPFNNLTIDKTTGSISPIGGTGNTSGHIYVKKNFTVNNGTWNVGGQRQLYVGGNFIVQTTGTFTADIGRLIMNSTNTTTPQTLSPGNNNLYKLTIDNNGAGVKLSTNVTVTYDLTLTNGIIYTRNSTLNYILYVSNSDPASIPAVYSTTSYVAGNLKRAIVAPNNYVFPVGNSNSILHKYRPLSLNLTSAGGASYLTICEDSVQNSGTYYACWWTKIAPDNGAPVGTVNFSYNFPLDFPSGMSECSISALRGTPPPTYNWNFVLTTTSPSAGGNNGSITSTLPANYSPYSYILGEPVPVAINPTICDGNQATLNITSPTGYGSFNWYNTQTGGSAFLTGNSTYTTPVLNDTTTFYVNHTNPQCEGHRYPVTINVNDIPTSTFTTQNPICFGNGAIASYTGTGIPAATYSWNFGGASATPGTGQGPQQLTGTAGQNYNVSLQVTQNGCTSTVTNGSITIPTALNAGMSNTNSTCGNSNGSATVTPTGGWGNYSFLWNNTSTNATINSVPSGTYLVTVTDQNGCTQTGSTTVSDVGAPSVTANALSPVSCFGGHDGHGGLTATGTGTLTYTWSNGVTGNGNSSVIIVVDTLMAGTYYITVSDQNGCQSVANIIITEPPVLSSTFTVSNALCYNQTNGSISSSASGGTSPYSFDWGFSTQPNLTNLHSGNYSVTITDTKGCTFIQSVLVDQPDSIVIGITEVPISCFGLSDGVLSAIVNGGTQPFTYSWSNGGNQQVISNLHYGIYFVIVSDANGCNSPMTDTLDQPDPIDVIPQAFPVTCHGDSDGDIYLNVSGGTPLYAFLWDSGNTTQDLNAIGAGEYWVTITDDNGCTAVASEMVTEPSLIISSSSSISVKCYGGSDGSAIAYIQGGVSPYLYNWSNSFNGSNNANIPSGNYSLTITDTNGCQDTLSVFVNQPSALIANGTITNVKCYNEANGSIELLVSGGTTPYSFEWGSSVYSQNIYGLTQGSYHVTITDGNNCQQNQFYNITQPDSLYITVTSTGSLCSGGNTGSILTSVSGGTPAYLLYWSNGSTNTSLSNLAMGTYTLTVTDANLCVLKDTVELIGSPAISVNISYIVTQGQASAEINGGTYPFTYLWNTGSTDSLIQNIQTGSYQVTVTDNYGCTATSSSDVIVDFLIPSIFTPNNDQINDTWEIKGIEAFSEVTIDIFDRWGDLIFHFNGTGYEYKNKSNQWNGEYKGKALPMTSFVFIVNLHNNEDPINGTVSIVR